MLSCPMKYSYTICSCHAMAGMQVSLLAWVSCWDDGGCTALCLFACSSFLLLALHASVICHCCVWCVSHLLLLSDVTALSNRSLPVPACEQACATHLVVTALHGLSDGLTADPVC